MRYIKLYKRLLLFLILFLLACTPVQAKTIKLTCGQTKIINAQIKYNKDPSILDTNKNRIHAKKPGKTILYTKNNKKLHIEIKRRKINKKQPIYLLQYESKQVSKKYKIKKTKTKIYKINKDNITGVKPGRSNLYLTTDTSYIIQPVIVQRPQFSKPSYHINKTIKIKLKDCYDPKKISYRYDSYYLEKTKTGFYAYEDYGITTIAITHNGHTFDTADVYIKNVIPKKLNIKAGRTKNLFKTKSRYAITCADARIANISNTGKITAKKPGTTRLYIEINNKKYTGSLIVTKPNTSYDFMKTNRIKDTQPYISPKLYKALLDFKIDYRVTNPLPAFPDDKDVAGYIDIENHEIYIRSDQNYPEIVYHEIGHFFNHVKGYISGTPEFYKIYKTEAFKNKTYFRDYARSSYNEYFAEAFVSYLFEPNILQEHAPKTYAYIHKNYINITDKEIQDLIKKYPIKSDNEQRAGAYIPDDHPYHPGIEYDPIL